MRFAGRELSSCAGNMRVVMDTLTHRAASMGGRYPASADWARIVETSAITSDLVCPARRDLPSGYALNSSLPRIVVRMVRSPESVVFLFESDGGWNTVGRPELLPDRPRHFGGDNYGFADGSVKWLRRKKLPDGSWAKEPDAHWVIWEPVLREQAAAADSP